MFSSKRIIDEPAPRPVEPGAPGGLFRLAEPPPQWPRGPAPRAIVEQCCPTLSPGQPALKRHERECACPEMWAPRGKSSSPPQCDAPVSSSWHSPSLTGTISGKCAIPCSGSTTHRRITNFGGAVLTRHCGHPCQHGGWTGAADGSRAAIGLSRLSRPLYNAALTAVDRPGSGSEERSCDGSRSSTRRAA